MAEVGDGDPCGSKKLRVNNVLETVKASENGHAGIRVFPVKNSGINNPAKFIYTNACSMGNKQKEL